MIPELPFHLSAFLTGLAAGVVARFLMLRVDYRQYPGYPHSYAAHLTHGFIAAGLGAIAWPALLSKELSAVTFLALAANQFRDIRRIEREALAELEATELVRRGVDYIEGIAKVFEARNYVVMFVALVASVTAERTAGALGGAVPGVASPSGVAAGLVAAALAYLLSHRYARGPQIGSIARVREGLVHFDGPLLKVGEIGLMNVGLEEDRQAILTHGVGALLDPLSPDARRTLADVGQRQAILHDVATVLGLRKDVDTVAFTPIARRDLNTGTIGFVVAAEERDFEVLAEVVRAVPLLETARSRAARLVTRVRRDDEKLGPRR